MSVDRPDSNLSAYRVGSNAGCAATFAVALRNTGEDELKGLGKSIELSRRTSRRLAATELPGNSGLSRQAVLLGTTAATAVMAINALALSRQISQDFLSTGPVRALRPMQSKLADSVSIKDYGAIGDGNSHPISSIATFNAQPTTGWTLDQWQAIFPFATALSNEIDGLAIQAAVNTGKAIRVPAGSYLCSLSITTD
jgi:hypothetical protein